MISFVGQNTATATTVTIPTHQAGDLILIFAYRTTTTAPTAGSGYTSPTNGNGSGDVNAFRIGYKFATSTSDTSGTWTNATQLVVQVYRGVAAVGAVANHDTTTSPGSIPTLTLTGTNSLSWVAGFIGSKQGTSQSTPGTLTNRAELKNAATSMVDGYDTNGGVSSWAAASVTLGTSTDSFAVSVELTAFPLASSLSDNLLGSTINTTNWATFNSSTGTTVATTGVGVTITPTTTANDDNELDSKIAYDLTGNAAYVNNKQACSDPNVETDFILAVSGASTRLIFLNFGGTMFAQWELSGTSHTVVSATYNATTMAWQRMRESGGVVFWDTSADGVTWSNFGSVATPFPVTNVLVAFTTFNDAATATPGSAIFAYYNVMPILTPSVSDSTTTSESVTVSVTGGGGGTPAINVSDSTTTSESIKTLELGFVSVSDSTTTSEAKALAIASTVSVSESSTTSESVPTPAISYGVDVDPSQMNPVTGAYFIQGVKIV